MPSPAHVEGLLPVPGGELRYLDSGGDGSAVLLLHAFTGSADSWTRQMDALADAGYRVVALSSRGAAGSTAEVAGASSVVQDIEALLDQLGLSRAHLVGTAAGGMRALWFTVARPDRVASLTLSCTLGGLSEPEYVQRQARLITPEFLALPLEVRELGPSYRYSSPEGVQEWLRIARTSEAATLRTLPADTGAALRDELLRAGPRYADLAALDLPVGLIYGGADLYAPPAVGRLLASKIPGAELSVVDESGHSAFWEQPEVFTELVIDVLARV